MIQATCRTNLDAYRREEWPQEFAEVPRVGDYVESASGRRLCVVRITHRHPKTRYVTGPYIEVELGW